MGRAGRAKFEREYTLARHVERMRRALSRDGWDDVDEVPEAIADQVCADAIMDQRRELQTQVRS